MHHTAVWWSQLTAEEKHERVQCGVRGRVAGSVRLRIEKAIAADHLTDAARRELAAVLLAGIDE